MRSFGEAWFGSCKVGIVFCIVRWALHEKERWPEPEVLASGIPPCHSLMVLISVVYTYRVTCTVDFERAAVV